MAGVVNYKWPVSGTTAPSSIAMTTVNMFIASIVLSDGDTGAVVTHNMGASVPAGYNGGNSGPLSDLANLFPALWLQPYSAPSSNTFYAGVTAVQTDSNTVTIAKIAATGSAQTVVLNVLRPHSLMR